MQREIFTDEHGAFRDMVRSFIAKEIEPFHEQWERDGIVSRDVWLAANALYSPSRRSGVAVPSSTSTAYRNVADARGSSVKFNASRPLLNTFCPSGFAANSPYPRACQ